MHKQVSEVVQEKRPLRARRRSRLGRSRGTSGASVARVYAVSGSNQVLVRVEKNPVPLIAQTTIPLGQKDVGADVVIFFIGSDPKRPIVMGRILSGPPTTEPRALQMKIDGQSVSIEAEHQIILRSGKASITLTRAGKVVIRGEYILSRSTGVNQVKGGSIKLN